MDRYAILSYVKTTSLGKYDNTATNGVDKIAGHIRRAIKPAFKGALADLGPSATKNDILLELQYAADNLSPNGICFFYFHGHGDSIPGRGIRDETKDQALVCQDDYLLDDEIDTALRSFKPTQRFLSIVDCCSAETVVEWSQYPHASYPQIIHIASARDEEKAWSLPQGGIFSKKLYNMIKREGYYGLTYKSFYTRLELRCIACPCYVRISENVSAEYLNTKLFK
jgi:hypothetical protein